VISHFNTNIHTWIHYHFSTFSECWIVGPLRWPVYFQLSFTPWLKPPGLLLAQHIYPNLGYGRIYCRNVFVIQHLKKAFATCDGKIMIQKLQNIKHETYASQERKTRKNDIAHNCTQAFKADVSRDKKILSLCNSCQIPMRRLSKV